MWEQALISINRIQRRQRTGLHAGEQRNRKNQQAHAYYNEARTQQSMSSQATTCGKLMSDFAGAGIAYDLHSGPVLALERGGVAIPTASLDWSDAKARKSQIESAAGATVFNIPKVRPSASQAAIIIAALLVLMALSGATYGSVAALLTEL